ncbi:hypothetical protein AMAG_09125 [Allomyces macrogynus ATCC 38327]|uniref:Etoposide-induced protein 2.4-domain-containing protein n=1 Tax=Allomyces macrogynus (strain ATCC 38327) TaxID=578462 RepID=A0A0L0SNJ1_ALLM3|nr:hypothetical protein AMAG_09125 [Allomyces macrogynus ATCC 38327]|eukprot:KNE64068.1 hypothetical protein AMAG_09125 [Allomyces macrogynus ATCC 38327]
MLALLAAIGNVNIRATHGSASRAAFGNQAPRKRTGTTTRACTASPSNCGSIRSLARLPSHNNQQRLRPQPCLSAVSPTCRPASLRPRGNTRRALQLPKALLIIYSSRTIQVAALKCLVLNGVVLLGSIVVFRYVVLALLQQLFGWALAAVLVTPDPSAPPPNVAAEVGLLVSFQSALHNVLTALYYVLWIYPVYALSFALNTVWCQEIADRALLIRDRHDAKRARPGSNPSSTVATSAPASTRPRASLTSLGADFAAALYRPLLCVVFLTLASALDVGPTVLGISSIPIHLVSRALSFAMTCWLHALYSFEYPWTARGVPLAARLARVEHAWAYHLGFGTPVTLASFFATPVVGGGTFAVLFPVFIILATLTDPPEPGTRARSATDAVGSAAAPPPSLGRLPIFGAVTAVCNAVIAQVPVVRKISSAADPAPVLAAAEPGRSGEGPRKAE